MNSTETGSPTQSCVYNLPKRNLRLSDAGTYYCAVVSCGEILFGNGTKLEVKGLESESKSVLQQPVSESVQPGDSVTLNCTINTGTCAGDHSVYWFRHDSGESHPGIIYTHGDRSGQCKNSTETGSPTQSCVYNLPKRNLSLSDAGTYYCAVVSCGEILFGNGTNLEIEAETVSQHGHQGNIHTSMSTRQLDDFTVVNYASLNFTDKKANQSRRPRRELREIRKQSEETIYSGLNHQNRM
ncbi:hypothetical protein DPEC_G00104040 [Dallia pectoralis]|uniref:Uncharacterized protein n=1 Tax=Dallia pectoralis TaxID=75939 RepID=A0ACC2GXQ0_DALPE|nr:hypothetical protein DPEC_G00104040 [Dallia pectoralis]